MRRLVYTSSVAAYGFSDDGPELLTEDVEPHATEAFYYSAQKAALESLLAELLDGSGVERYVFRPCIVAGPDAPALIHDLVGTFQIGGRLPIERELLRMIPGVSPLLPDPGMEIQLVHHDDCAEALVAAVEGRGTPGIYNLAGPGTITLSDVAEVLGWRSVRLPHVAVDASTELVARLGRLLPQNLEWINVARRSVPMSTAKAADELGWAPQRSIEQTLRDTVDGARAAGII